MDKNEPTFLLIDEDETYWVEIFNAKFKYRRISPIKADELQEQCTVRGKMNNTKLYLEMLKYCLLNWEGIKGRVEGKIIDLPFDEKYLPGIPQSVILQLVKRFTSAFVETEEELKNCPTTFKTE